jgi:non-reducing end alpha-L-arabinofuranosidase
VRNVSPVKINEFRISDGSTNNSTNSFIELYNASDIDVDISSWTLTQHQTQLPVFSSVKVPVGTKLAAHGFYLLGLSNSGLAVPAKKGESTIYVRNITGMSVGDAIEIDNGSVKEMRKITGVGTAAGLGEPKTPSPFGGRPVEPGSSTTLWQPLPDGPVITIPVGSKNIPVTNVDGFEVGQKMAIGYGAKYPTVSQTIESYEVVTVTQVGKPGTQAWLTANAKAGETNLKVSSVANISVGDKIRLDIDSKGHGIETVTVKRVGTQSVRNAFNGPLKNEELGTGLELEQPMKFNHSYNIPFSARGTGISFEPATAFAHSSNEPVLPLGTGITLDKPLTLDHTIDVVIRDQKVTTAGYQGTAIPNQWFGGPALSSSAGNMVLRDATGKVVDGLNYGGLVDPWSAEGYQATSGAGESGCFAPTPAMGRGGFRMGPSTPTVQPDRSTGRYPDGADSDSNCRDFQVQNAITVLAAPVAGSNNIKVGSVVGFSIGQKIIIDRGANAETSSIAIVGTTGGTTLGAAIKGGTKTFSVASVEGFGAGQAITIDNGSGLETAVVASVVAARRRFGQPTGNTPTPTDSITVAVPLAKAHAGGVQVSGSGITLATPLAKSHANGTPIASSIPTPGEPNQFIRKP